MADDIADLQQSGYVLSSPEKIPAPQAPVTHWTESQPSIQFGTALPFDIRGGSSPYSSDPSTMKESPPPNTLTSTVPAEMDSTLSHDGMKEFEQMIDKMVYKVWDCGRCLRMGHTVSECTFDIRCRACFSYGHIAKACLSKAKEKKKQIWVPKRVGTGIGTESPGNITDYTMDVPSSIPPQQSSPPPPPSSVPPPTSSQAESMAVFEVDPMPWLPWGHQVIDGGPTRLPRTYYYAAEDPPAQHHSYCIAVMDPAPPPLDEAHWRNQVLNFLTGPLNRNVLDHQPSLFGIGLYKLSSPNAVNALVNHGHFQVHNSFVRFIRADDKEQNHRASQGFRRGWLMMLGIHPDYHNDLDIANAISTFGKFHNWNRDDPIKERVLVYASFPSPALVPRDVVFGKFATVGGVKESWTAPVFILSADFADVLPADEDPMPLDGNPHPLPGNLQPHPNLFVNPQYPEIGWDIGPEQHFDAPVNGNNNGNQMEEEVGDVQESMVMNVSNNSQSSVNMIHQGNLQVQAPGDPVMNVIQVGRVMTFVGPSLPPHMIWDKLFCSMMPELYAKSIPRSLQVPPFAFVKWNMKDANVTDCQGKSMRLLQGSDGMIDAAVEQCSTHVPTDTVAVLTKERSVARSLDFDKPSTEEATTVFSASPMTVKAKRGRKSRTMVVQPEERRFTRSCLKKDGCRPAPVLAIQPRPKKRSHAKFLLELPQDEGVHSEEDVDQGEDTQDFINIPATPVAVMQRVGSQLGIAPEKLTKEKLEADLVTSSSTDDHDEDV
ncbi:hypothetical protein ACQ4PT_039719 [Festuca glaucescens]